MKALCINGPLNFQDMDISDETQMGIIFPYMVYGVGIVSLTYRRTSCAALRDGRIVFEFDHAYHYDPGNNADH